MKTFEEKIDMRNRSEMTSFLKGHFRYDTMSSWNRVTSYANCVKIHCLDLTSDQLEQAWDMVNMPQVHNAINLLLDEWAAAHDWRWQVGFNGRSSGYLVLYQGGIDLKNAYTTKCDTCGKLTWYEQDMPCTTDGCEGMLHVLSKPRPQIVTYSGRGTDEGEDFSDWSMDDLRDRVRLVQDFDRLCDAAVRKFVSFCDNYRVAEEEILVSKKVRVLEPV